MTLFTLEIGGNLWIKYKYKKLMAKSYFEILCKNKLP